MLKKYWNAFIKIKITRIAITKTPIILVSPVELLFPKLIDWLPKEEEKTRYATIIKNMIINTVGLRIKLLQLSRFAQCEIKLNR